MVNIFAKVMILLLILVTEILRFAPDDKLVFVPRPSDEGSIARPCLVSGFLG